MTPLGNHIEIEPIPEQRSIIMSKSLYQRATVKQVSPDLKIKLQPGTEISYVGERQVNMPGQIFLNVEFVVLWE